jgi:hypothetical protein
MMKYLERAPSTAPRPPREEGSRLQFATLLGPEFLGHDRRALASKKIPRTVFYHANYARPPFSHPSVKYEILSAVLRSGPRRALEVVRKYSRKQKGRKEGGTPPQDIDPLVNFFVNGCKDEEGNAIPLDCEKIWTGYQLEITKPGCSSCNKRKARKKVIRLLATAGIELS